MFLHPSVVIDVVLGSRGIGLQKVCDIGTLSGSRVGADCRIVKRRALSDARLLNELCQSWKPSAENEEEKTRKQR